MGLRWKLSYKVQVSGSLLATFYIKYFIFMQPQLLQRRMSEELL